MSLRCNGFTIYCLSWNNGTHQKWLILKRENIVGFHHIRSPEIIKTQSEVSLRLCLCDIDIYSDQSCKVFVYKYLNTF